jgi:hypothetical protein
VDSRAWIVLLVLALCIIGTVVVYAIGLGHDPVSFFGAIFAAWVGGLALFLVLGLVVAIVSLEHPETEPFQTRALILFRKQTGEHINYIIRKMSRNFETYTESQIVTITLVAYDPGQKRYQIAIHNRSLVRGYIDDINSTYRTDFDYSGVTLPPQGQNPNRVVYVRVNGEQRLSEQQFRDTITRVVETTVIGKEPCLVESLIHLWIDADSEPNTHRPPLFTQNLEFNFENHLGFDAMIRLIRPADRERTVAVRAGGQVELLKLVNLEPDIDYCDYRILAPP